MYFWSCWWNGTKRNRTKNHHQISRKIWKKKLGNFSNVENDEFGMKRRTVYKWVDRFKEKRESIDDDARARRLSCVDENIQRVHDLVKIDRRITTRMVAEKLGISNDNSDNFKRRFKHAEAVCKNCSESFD